MARLTVNGHTVTVDDSFKSLSAAEQEATVNEIAASLPKQVAATAKIEPPAQDERTTGTVQNIARAVRGGIPFGDRMAAAAKAVEPHLFDDKGNVSPHLGNGMGYAENLANERARAEDFAQAHPFVSGAGNIAGMAATIPFTPARLLTAGNAAAPMLTRAGQVAKAGAVLGGVQGLSDTPDLTSPMSAAGHTAGGAALGAALGGAAPVAGKAIGATASALADALRGYGPDLSGPAGRSLARAMKTFAPGELDDTLQKLGPEATLMDTSPAFIGKAQGISGNSPEARTTLANFLKERSEGTSNRLFGDVNENLGTAYSKDRANADMEAFRGKRDRKNYRKALAGEPHVSDVDVEGLISYIDNKLPRAEGGELEALTNAKKLLVQPNPEYDTALKTLRQNTARAEDYMPEASAGGSDSIRNFVRGLGGIMDEGGDLKSREINKEMVGLLNKRGLPLDKAREAAAEAGYFDNIYGSTDDAVANSTVNDLLDAIESNASHPGSADNEWMRGVESMAGGRSGMWDDARRMASEANEAAKNNLPPRNVPKTRAENLHKIKGMFDDIIEYPDRKALGVRGSDVSRAQGTLKDVRFRLNKALEQNIEGYQFANRQSEAMAKRQEALKSGYDRVLGSGPKAYWTQDLAVARKAMSPGERAAQAMGTRARIEEKLRQTANDLTAGKSIVGGENDFNRQNLAEVFGEDATNNVINAVEREKAFANTANRVTGNSETAPRQAAAREEAPVNIGHLANIKRALVGPILDRISERLPLSAQYYPEMAKVLSATGGDRDRYIQMLVNGLQRSNATEKVATDFGNRAAILGALLGDNVVRGAVLPVTDRPARP